MDGFLDAGGLREVAAGFHIMDGVEDFFVGLGELEGAVEGAQTFERGVLNVQAEAVGRGRRDAFLNFGEVRNFFQPFEKSALLGVGEFMKKGRGAKLAAE